MPMMDGIQATRQIKQNWPAARVVMLTTFKDEKNIRLAIRAGAKATCSSRRKYRPWLNSCAA